MHRKVLFKEREYGKLIKQISTPKGKHMHVVNFGETFREKMSRVEVT